MNRVVPFILLVLGIGLAASFGARNGPSHTAWRQAKALHAELAAVSGLPTMSEDPEEAKSLTDAREAAIAVLVQSGALAEGADLDMAVAAARDAIPAVPEPRTRLSEWVATGSASFGLGVMFIGVGAFLARRQQAEEAAGGGSAGELDFPGTVARLHTKVADLAEQAAAIPMDDDAPALRAQIEALHNDDIAPLVEGRGVFIARHGIGGFAEYFGPFSAGERNLARAWSGLTDGHSEVATTALRDSSEAFGRAAGAWPNS